MMRKTALALVFTVGFAGTALAQANIVGKYEYTGTETDGSKYPEAGTLVIANEKSGAFHIKWDDGEYVGIGQVTGNVLAVAAVADKKNTIMLMEIGPDGNLTGKWWRRNDPGSKGSEVWKKK